MNNVSGSAREDLYTPEFAFVLRVRMPLVIILFCGLFPPTVSAQSEEPTPLLPSSFRWLSPPNNPALQAAWVLGNEQKPGPHLLRVRLAAGGRISPHTHSDERNSTVLAGTLYVGFGETFDESKVIAVPAGAVYVTPAKLPHYVWAKSGEVIYQEAGVGPTATSFLKE